MPESQSIVLEKAERLKAVRKAFNLSQQEFAEMIGTHQGNLAKMEGGKRPIGANVEFKILITFLVSKAWWDSGEGSMLNESKRFTIEDIIGERKIESNAVEIPMPQPGEEHEFELIKKEDSTEFRHLGDDRYLVICPLVEQFAYAGYISGWSDPAYVDEMPRHVVVLSNLTLGIYRAFTVKGDSMDNGLRGAICDGDIVTGRKLHEKHWRNRLHTHKYKNFIFVTNEGITIKEVAEHRVDEGILVCRSRNPDKEQYPDFELSLADVREIYYVKALTEPTF